jgi:hypothetical protein
MARHPFFNIITIPISIYRDWDGYDGSSQVYTFDKPETGATSILQAVIWVSPKRQLRNVTLAPSCASYASCAAALADCTCTRFSACGDDLQDPWHTGFSPHSNRGLSKSSVMPLSGAEEGSLLLLFPTPVRSLYTQVTAQKA